MSHKHICPECHKEWECGLGLTPEDAKNFRLAAGDDGRKACHSDWQPKCLKCSTIEDFQGALCRQCDRIRFIVADGLCRYCDVQAQINAEREAGKLVVKE